MCKTRLFVSIETLSMSHVISSQPSTASPYKPTETNILNSHGSRNSEAPTRIISGEERNSRDCCCYVDENDGCCLYVICRIFSRCFLSIGECTEACCDGCANCLNDCCEDKPRDRRTYYVNSYNRRRNCSDTDSAYNYDNTDWLDSGNNDSFPDTGIIECYDIRDDKCDSGGDAVCCDFGGGGDDSGGGCDSGGGDTGGCCDD